MTTIIAAEPATLGAEASNASAVSWPAISRRRYCIGPDFRSFSHRTRERAGVIRRQPMGE